MPELYVSKKKVSELLNTQDKKNIIPEYQRSYDWDLEKCETLWDDIEDFYNSIKNKENSDEVYFLGTIVSYENKDGNFEIIDGQQRIISFTLLLRAFYKKLEDENNKTAKVEGLKRQIGCCLWKVDKFSQQVNDKKNIHIESKVITEEERDILYKILETGEYKEESKDNYNKNFGYFYNKCIDYAQKQTFDFYDLSKTILDRCIVLPINCEKKETSLTIFSTLNDRGMQLADSDIFKAEMYRLQNHEKKTEFNDKWKELNGICKKAKISVDDVFRFYSHVIRAKNEDKSKEIGLRKFYSKHNYKLLEEENLIDILLTLASFWLSINTISNDSNEELEELEELEFSFETKKYLHCLKHYSNDFWKYIVTVYFYKKFYEDKNIEDFNEKFPIFLKKIISFLFIKYVQKPSVNYIKDDIYKNYVNLYHDKELTFSSLEYNDELKKKISEYSSSSKIMKALLLLHAYQNESQKSLIPVNFNVEHIFPQKWQNTNYNGWEREDAEIFLENFGNKVVIEKKVNIQAGNNYFGKKKERYKDSKVELVKSLLEYEKDDWVKEDIEEREKEFLNSILSFFNKSLKQ